MPRGDGTGPLGQGPRTGRAAGYCAGYSVPGYMNPAGRGFSGHGGRGRFRWYWRSTCPPVYPAPAAVPPPAFYPMEPKDEVKYLEGVAAQLKKELEAIEKRVNELSTE